MQQYKSLEQAFHGTYFFWLTTFPHDECIDSKALSNTYKSTALSSGRVDVKLRPKSIRTCNKYIYFILSNVIATRVKGIE